MSFDEYLDRSPNGTIYKIIMTCHAKMQEFQHPLVSISGGADSDIMLDIVENTKGSTQVKYVFFNTGIEYEATKRHLAFLESKYGIEIDRLKAKTPVPLAINKYGSPFLQKLTAQLLNRLQQHGFQWEDEPYEVLIERYPNCVSALKWWCNAYEPNSAFNISRLSYLKEYIISNPPTFHISDNCCHYAKKNVAKEAIKIYKPDLMCTGVRRAEQGVRSVAYKNCFSQSSSYKVAEYRPLFFMTDEDKIAYENEYGITHSDCYTKYGLKRTGCAGCPFGSKFLDELAIIHEHEPKLEVAIRNIFNDSYEYTLGYREFKNQMKKKGKEKNGV